MLKGRGVACWWGGGGMLRGRGWHVGGEGWHVGGRGCHVGGEGEVSLCLVVCDLSATNGGPILMQAGHGHGTLFRFPLLCVWSVWYHYQCGGCEKPNLSTVL